uniref:Testis-expressed sequence 30 protein-like n=1 Tax=Saccoglossus kowalevskii TaxID=10224 RepID=A0ABM0MQ51_SACKO|nr:PREDICTED: testis-expressed sequence 30 protein-like [Saccoglossus kowalevskii]
MLVPSPSTNPLHYAVILTHGATGNMNNTQLQTISQYLTTKGFICLRFTYISSRVENRMKAYHAVVEFLQNYKEVSLKGCFVAGRSMGSRAAVCVANAMKNDFIKGVICLSYPLHPPRKLTSLRNEILQSLTTPTLFITGTKDAFCTKTIMEDTLKSITCVKKMKWIEGADHSINIKGQTDNGVMVDVCDEIYDWCLKHVTRETQLKRPAETKDCNNDSGKKKKCKST